MLLIVGLGNPGPEHAKNRHNIGFMAADEIVRRHGFGPWKSRFHGLMSEGRLGPHKALVLKPVTYMNRSGISASEAARFYKIPLDQIVVFHDELDLAAGKLRVKTGGGSAGNNGIRSLDSHIGPDYRRVRMGIGHPGRDRVLSYVLEDFRKEEQTWLQPLLDAVAEAATLLAEGNDSAFMTKVALLTRQPAPEK